MRPTELLQEIRKMRFEDTFSIWTEGRITQEEAARMLGVCPRTFRRYVDRYHNNGLDGLLDKRLTQASARKAPVDEVMSMIDRYKDRYNGWTAKHYFAWYRREGGTRSYSWVKNKLQEKDCIKKAPKRGAHRKRRERTPMPGMMIHQDGSTHEWVPDQKWDLIVTMDDATNEHYSMFFVDEEGTHSSMQGVKDVIQQRGLFCSFYSDRGSHYWHTPQAGGKVDKKNLTQFGRAMQQLGIGMIAAYSPQARGRSERAFHTHQSRLVKELALHDIRTMEAANLYLKESYLPAFNEEFMQPAMIPGSAFISWIGGDLDDILCEQDSRTVGRDNCVSFNRLILQIPANDYRCNYIKVRVRVLRYLDGSLAIFHGPRKLASYDQRGELMTQKKAQNQ
jgi:transposase